MHSGDQCQRLPPTSGLLGYSMQCHQCILLWTIVTCYQCACTKAWSFFILGLLGLWRMFAMSLSSGTFVLICLCRHVSDCVQVQTVLQTVQTFFEAGMGARCSFQHIGRLSYSMHADMPLVSGAGGSKPVGMGAHSTDSLPTLFQSPGLHCSAQAYQSICALRGFLEEKACCDACHHHSQACWSRR